MVDAEGRCVTPGFVDAHTHLVFAGNRAAEFEMRIAGASYQQIAAAGRRHSEHGAGHARRL